MPRILPFAPFAGLDPILILPGSQNLQAAGVLATSLPVSYPVPPLPLLRGTRVSWQAATVDASNGLQISNAATNVHYRAARWCVARRSGGQGLDATTASSMSPPFTFSSCTGSVTSQPASSSSTCSSACRSRGASGALAR